MTHDNDDALDRPAGLTIAPNGKKVAYHVRTRTETTETTETESSSWTYTSSIWVADVGKAHLARRITDGTSDDRSPKWSADGAYIAFLSNRDQPHEKYELHRYWFGVDALPVPCLSSWSLTQFAFPPRGRVLIVWQYGLTGWDQRFADDRSLEVGGTYKCSIQGRGYVTAVATRVVPSRRYGVSVSPDEAHNRDAAFLTRPRYDPASARGHSHIWLGGDRRAPKRITVATRPEYEPFPFAVVDLAWAGTKLYILAGGDVGREDGQEHRLAAVSPLSFKPTIHRLDNLDGFHYACTEVYGAGDNDGHVLGISGLRDDLLIHTRNEAGDTLRLLHAGRTIWQQKDGIHEAVATKVKRRGSGEGKNDHKVMIVAVVSADGQVFAAEVADKVTGESSVGSGSTSSGVPAERVQLSKDSTDDAPAVVRDEHTAALHASSPVPRTEDMDSR